MRTARVILVATILCGLFRPSSASADEYGVAFLDHGTPTVLTAGSRATVSLTIRNTGTLSWKRSQQFRLSYHWTNGAGNAVVRDGVRTELTRDVNPGETIQLCAIVVAPDVPGAYQLQWDMVHEQHAWFSDRDRGNLLTAPVTVTNGDDGPVDIRTLAAAALFWFVTLVPIPLTACWIYLWWGRDIQTWDEFVFHTVVFGAGQIYLVLQVLVFTIGMRLGSVAIAIALVHGAIAARWWTTRDRRRTLESAPPSSVRDHLPTLLELTGGSLVLGLVMQWAWVSSRGMEILGTDAANYHVPHALNFSLGVNPMEFLATPHLYPMGTSVWAAWFFKPFGDPLLLDLAIAPAFLLLFASACLMFRLLTGRSGLTWTPWLLLVAFSTPLARVSMLMSADLPYAAGFVAATAQLMLIVSSRRLDARHVIALALCAGWMTGSKSTGVVSLVYMSLCAVFALAILYRKGQPVAGFRPSTFAIAATVFVAAGGIWIVRNWWLYGSPLAPYGVSAFGVQIFPGPPSSGTRYYLSVLGDMRSQPSYPVWHRFLESAREMFGPWIVPAVWIAILLPVDVGAQLLKDGRLSDQAKAKLLYAAFVLLGFAVHAVVIAGLPWTSLEWTRNLSIRYLLPFFFLYLIGLYSVLFTDAVKWDRIPALGAPGLAVAACAALWFYHGHEATPGLPEDRWLAVLSPTMVLAAAALVVPAVLALAGRGRVGNTLAFVTIAAVLMGTLTWESVSDHRRIAQERAQQERQEMACGVGGAPPSSEHRGLYLGVVTFQQAQKLSCQRTRFFVASRFDRPIELQDAGYRNLVLDARVSSPSALQQQGPADACDVVLASNEDLKARGPMWLNDLFKTSKPFEQIAAYGRYAALVVK